MFTVILYWDKKSEDGEIQFTLEKYDFLFSFMQTQNRVVKRKYNGNCEQTISDLNLDTEHMYEWRLLLFDGRPITDDKGILAPDTIRIEWSKLLLQIFEKGNGAEQRLGSFTPKEVWYLGCCKKGVYTSQNTFCFSSPKLLISQEGTNKVEKLNVRDAAVDIPALRMCWVEVILRGGMLYRQEEFRLCCILLILACNNIPSSFMSGDFLYKINMEIERGQLAKYIGKLYQLNIELGEQVQKAIEYYYVVEQERVSYMPPDEIYFLSDEGKCSRDMTSCKIKSRDLASGREEELNDKLKKNRQWMNEQLHMFQNNLHQQVTKPIALMTPNKEILLDAAGQSTVQMEMRNALHMIYEKRAAEDNPLKVANRLTNKEKILYQEKERQLNSLEGRLVKWILAIAEGITFASFGIELLLSSMRKLGQFVVKTDFIDNLSKFLESENIYNSILKVILFLIFILIIYVMMWIPSYYNRAMMCYRYNKNLYKILGEQKKKQKNVSDVLKAVKQYQYHFELWDRQMYICEELKKEKKFLLHHSIIQKEAANICKQLEQMIGEDEKVAAKKILLPEIDFYKEPKQMEYYWVPLQSHRKMCSLNNSGHEVDVIFDFISELKISKTPELRSINEK